MALRASVNVAVDTFSVRNGVALLTAYAADFPTAALPLNPTPVALTRIFVQVHVAVKSMLMVPVSGLYTSGTVATNATLAAGISNFLLANGRLATVIVL